MGTTLENGVYLPSEGERNCYAGLKTNWEILDQKVADVTALQQAVAGALHREIVESLPTTDINPNTIYMVLSGTSATENVYNEYMYVNNAWELIGTSATDLTNYYTKAEVDGKLLLKANASDLTSHTGDTTIHVTTADKNKWNNQTYVFRYSSTALVASSTNSNALLDNTDNLKVGDKVIDSSGVLFSITAIDTQNSTFTIGTALVDLATDGDVVHKSGNETVGGSKSFSGNTYIYNSDNTATTPSLYLRSSKIEISSQGNTSGDQNLTYLDKNNTTYAYVKGAIQSNGSAIKIRAVAKDSSDNSVINELQILAYTNGNKAVFPSYSNEVDLGVSSYKWKGIFATNYYYGSNNVEFSTKFVTTDTAQTISGSKTFEGVDLKLKSVVGEYTVSSGSTSLLFYDKNSLLLSQYKQGVYGGGISYQTFTIAGYDSNNQQVNKSITFSSSYLNMSIAFLKPDTDNAIALGRTTNKWSDVQTYKVNALEPSSLSLPSGKSARIDISSYFTNLGSGDINSYSVSANGYIYMQLKDIATVHCFDFESLSTTVADYIQTFSRGNDGQLYVLFPVKKDHVFKSQWYTNSTVTISGAYFIPCQGNV